MQEPRCDLRSEQGLPSYGWWRVKILNGGRSIGRAKKEGRNSYRGVWYWFYGKSPKQTVLRAGQTVLYMHPALNLLHHGPVCSHVQCRNAGWQCTGCYCWGKCRNKGQLIPSPTTTRGLLGIFPGGADPPATNLSAPTLPVQSPTSSYLRALSVDGSRGQSTRGGILPVGTKMSAIRQAGLWRAGW